MNTEFCLLNSEFGILIKLSNLLTKVLQNYKSSKYTLEKIDIDEAISEYQKILMDDELNSISLFYGGLALAYKKKFMNSSLVDSMDFEFLDLSIDNYNKAQKISVKILDIDINKERISLSVKHLKDDPIKDFISNIKVGNIKENILKILPSEFKI